MKRCGTFFQNCGIKIRQFESTTPSELDYAINSQKEHQRIFAALEARDALAARTEMEKHILRSMEDALTYYL